MFDNTYGISNAYCKCTTIFSAVDAAVREVLKYISSKLWLIFYFHGFFLHLCIWHILIANVWSEWLHLLQLILAGIKPGSEIARHHLWFWVKLENFILYGCGDRTLKNTCQKAIVFSVSGFSQREIMNFQPASVNTCELYCGPLNLIN